MPDVCLISGGDHSRQSLRSPVNHKVFATSAGMDYRFEVGPYRGLNSPYFFKLEALRSTLPRYDWVVWMDDDAFVTDFSGSFAPFIAAAESAGKCLVAADSPVTGARDWTRLNSGVLLVKNCPSAFELLRATLGTRVSELAARWDAEKNGRFTHGDQDALIWAIDTAGAQDQVDIVDHHGLNARVYEYTRGASDHFICHFVGVPHKRAAVSAFASRFGLDETLVPPATLAEFAVRPEPRMSALAARVAVTRAGLAHNNVLRKAVASARALRHS